MSEFKIIVNFDCCNGCGSCVDVCPSECYEDPVDGKVVIALPDDCIGCEACVSACPDECITIESE